MSNETPFFFENRKNQRLFGILHTPDNQESKLRGKAAIIYCHPLFEEKLHSHRVMVNFARCAANQGYHVFRFDCFGDGESDGLFEQASISSRISDIFDAIRIVQHRVQPARIFLLGLRLGATLATLLSNEYDVISGVVAWSPIIRPKQYVYDMLRVNLSTQMVVHKKILHNRDALVEQIQSGETVNVDGYEISNAFWQEAKDIDIETTIQNLRPPLLVVQISPSLRPEKELRVIFDSKKRDGINCRIVKERNFWLPQRVVYSPCKELFSVTLKWIQHICT